jgi:hypothetical protein
MSTCQLARCPLPPAPAYIPTTPSHAPHLSQHCSSAHSKLSSQLTSQQHSKHPQHTCWVTQPCKPPHPPTHTTSCPTPTRRWTPRRLRGYAAACTSSAWPHRTSTPCLWTARPRRSPSRPASTLPPPRSCWTGTSTGRAGSSWQARQQSAGEQQGAASWRSEWPGRVVWCGASVLC